LRWSDHSNASGDRLAVYAESGVDRLLIGLHASRGVDELLPHLESLATLVADLWAKPEMASTIVLSAPGSRIVGWT
jgi:hypothetical protein